MGKKIIAAGHICLDITPVIGKKKTYEKVGQLLEPGKLIHVDGADVHTGGSVANTGLALKVLGNDVTLMGKVGCDEFGLMIENILMAHGVSGLLKDETSSTSYSVVLALPGLDRIFLHHPGANDTFSGDDIPEDACKDVAIFHFGYPPLMKRMYEQDGAELKRILGAAKKQGAATSLDFAAIDPESKEGQLDWVVLLQNVLPLTDIFVPSFEELIFMLDRERYDQLASSGDDMITQMDVTQDVEPLADKLLAMGCKIALIKCGKKGMYVKTAGKEAMRQVGENLALDTDMWADKSYYQPCFVAPFVKSETGAGDTSIAAFLTAVMQGETPECCARLAAAEGACAVTTYDAISGLKTIEQLKEMIENGWEMASC